MTEALVGLGGILVGAALTGVIAYRIQRRFERKRVFFDFLSHFHGDWSMTFDLLTELGKVDGKCSASKFMLTGEDNLLYLTHRFEALACLLDSKDINVKLVDCVGLKKIAIRYWKVVKNLSIHLESHDFNQNLSNFTHLKKLHDESESRTHPPRSGIPRGLYLWGGGFVIGLLPAVVLDRIGFGNPAIYEVILYVAAAVLLVAAIVDQSILAWRNIPRGEP